MNKFLVISLSALVLLILVFFVFAYDHFRFTDVTPENVVNYSYVVLNDFVGSTSSVELSVSSSTGYFNFSLPDTFTGVHVGSVRGSISTPDGSAFEDYFYDTEEPNWVITARLEVVKRVVNDDGSTSSRVITLIPLLVDFSPIVYLSEGSFFFTSANGFSFSYIFDFNSLSKIFEYVFDYQALSKPVIFDNDGYEVGDVVTALYEIFWEYPSWLLNYILLPLNLMNITWRIF